ncbi:MAG: hypothetical protein ACYTFM_03575 [Planctomycetota bacterium]|jgi:hypothetical protein
MIQCTECELCEIGPDGRRIFRCDPFSNIKEPECITKWQLIRLDMLASSYQGMFEWQKKFAPLSEKILKYMEREISDLDEADSWKLDVEGEDKEDKKDKEEDPY